TGISGIPGEDSGGGGNGPFLGGSAGTGTAPGSAPGTTPSGKPSLPTAGIPPAPVGQSLSPPVFSQPVGLPISGPGFPGAPSPGGIRPLGGPLTGQGQLRTTGLTIKPLEGNTWTGGLGTFTDSDGNTNPALYTATINWGDSTPTSTGTITYSSGTFTVTGS